MYMLTTRLEIGTEYQCLTVLFFLTSFHLKNKGKYSTSENFHACKTWSRVKLAIEQVCKQ